MPKPVLTTLAAVRRLLRELLAVMEANEAGVIENRDIECLHDFRVALRKMRTAMGQIRQVYRQDVLEPCRRELAWLASMTTPVRDLDVYLAGFDELTAGLPAEMHDDLRPLKAILQVQHQQAHAELVEALASSRYSQFKQDLRALLNNDIDPTLLSTNALRPVDGVARQLIWRRYKKLMKQAAVLKSESPDEDFHRVRKSAKKLRYLMEFFADRFPKKSIRSLLKHLKGIQDNLGEIQDLHVQIAALQHYADIMLQTDRDQSAALLAMGALTENLLLQKATAHDRFERCFQDFARHNIQKRFEKLFHN